MHKAPVARIRLANHQAIGGTEILMRRTFIEPTVPAGLAFEIADLILMQSWAEFHELRMVVELDHRGADGEYEEMVAVYAKDSPVLRWLLWRTDEIVVQPLIGRTIHCPSIADTLEILSPQLRSSD
jgi:hypothetical protein